MHGLLFLRFCLLLLFLLVDCCLARPSKKAVLRRTTRSRSRLGLMGLTPSVAIFTASLTSHHISAHRKISKLGGGTNFTSEVPKDCLNQPVPRGMTTDNPQNPRHFHVPRAFFVINVLVGPPVRRCFLAWLLAFYSTCFRSRPSMCVS